MKLRYIIALLLITLSAICCRSKKETFEEKEQTVIKQDSVVYKERIVIKEGIRDTITIHEICDSVTGNLSIVNTKLKSPSGTAEVFSDGEDLKFVVDIFSQVDSTLFDYQRFNFKDHADSIKTEYVKVYVWSKWTWIFLVIIIVETLILIYILTKKFTSITNLFK